MPIQSRLVTLQVITLLGSIWGLIACAQPVDSTEPQPDIAIVAVATNFKIPAEKLVEHFQRDTPHKITLVSGSTGKLYAQILNGAPFDLFLAADQLHPRLLEEQGLAVAGSQTTYATGQLVLLGREPVDKDTLLGGEFAKLALANPKLAPYGQAAEQTLQTLSLDRKLRAKLVFGQNVGQAYALVSTGNAALGFVAAAQLSSEDVPNSWFVSQQLYQPIHQDLVLLRRGRNNMAAQTFMLYLKNSSQAHDIIVQAGYLMIKP